MRVSTRLNWLARDLQGPVGLIEVLSRDWDALPGACSPPNYLDWSLL